MTEREKAPTRLPDQGAVEYLQQVISYLNEPHRRRLGDGTLTEMQNAIDELTGPEPRYSTTVRINAGTPETVVRYLEEAAQALYDAMLAEPKREVFLIRRASTNYPRFQFHVEAIRRPWVDARNS